MKKLLFAAALAGLAACANTRSAEVQNAEAVNAPAAECDGACGEGADCCSEKAGADDVQVCPVTGATGAAH